MLFYYIIIRYTSQCMFNISNYLIFINEQRKETSHMNDNIFQTLISEYSWLLVSGILLLLFNNTITEVVDGLMIFLGNDYNEDDVVEVDGEPGRIIRVGIWKTVFFIYHIVNGKIVGGSKLVVANSKLKDLKIEKPLPNLDLSKYNTDDS